MEIENPDGQWHANGEVRHEEDVIAAERVRIIRAQRLCCPDHGVQTVVLMDVQGQIAGIPIELTVELTLESAETVGQKFLEIRGLTL
jgi:hypothetical protein